MNGLTMFLSRQPPKSQNDRQRLATWSGFGFGRVVLAAWPRVHAAETAVNTWRLKLRACRTSGVDKLQALPALQSCKRSSVTTVVHSAGEGGKDPLQFLAPPSCQRTPQHFLSARPQRHSFLHT